MRKVFKFGGTSMGSIERIGQVADLCLKHRPLAVVVSAMAGETNRLVALGKEISVRTDVPEYDMLVASGEQVSVALLSMALRERGLTPVPMLATNAGIRTTKTHSRAQILEIESAHIVKEIENGFFPVIAGFQGVTDDGFLTSLGRGGSDTSAVAIAVALKAEMCVIYTDVDGVFTADPRICPQARIIKKIQFEEMLEMASQGSKVLHIRSVQLAAKYGIRLVVRNTFTDSEGTEMHNEESLESEIVTGIAHSKQEVWVTLSGLQNTPSVLADVFGLLAENSINVDIISRNEGPSGLTLHFTIDEADVLGARRVLEARFSADQITVNANVGKVSIVGVGMRTHAGVAARMFRALLNEKIDVLLVTTSEIKVACLIARNATERAVRALHNAFLEP